MNYVLRAYGGNLSSCLLLGPPQLVLCLISLTAMIPAVFSRNLCKKFVGRAKVAVNPLEATGERDTSGIRPPGWWALIESGTLVLRCMLHWNSRLWLYLSHLLCPNHAVPSTSQSVSRVYILLHSHPLAYCPRLVLLRSKEVAVGCVREKMSINISWLTPDIVPPC